MADVTGGTPPTGASPFRPPEDYKAAYDHFGAPEMFSRPTVADLPSSGNWAGRTLTVADKGVVHVWNGSWKPLISEAHQASGSAPGAGVVVPGGAVSLGGLIVKTGLLRSFTSVSFGNEYMPSVVFDSPFPTAVLAVTVTPFNIAGGPQAPARPFALDSMTASEFRAMLPSSGTSTDRAITWMAVGY